MLHLRALPNSHRKATQHIRVELHNRLRKELGMVMEETEPPPTGLGRAGTYPDRHERRRRTYYWNRD
jgi:hypothetical protein